MKKIVFLLTLTCMSLFGFAQSTTYINTTFNINAGDPVTWYGDVLFGPEAIVYIENGAVATFYGKNMTIDPNAKFIALPGNNQIGTGTIVFKENNPLYAGYPMQQTLNGGFTTGLNPSLLNIEIDNTDGVSLTGNTRVTNQVKFTKGHIFLNDFDLVLGDQATLNSYDVTKHVITNGTGVLTKEGVDGNASFVYPVSRLAGEYTPATVTNMAALRSISVQVKDYASSAANETTFATKGMDRTWQVTSSIAGLANISLQHNAANNANGTGTNESAFLNNLAYVSQQTAPGVWSASCNGTDGGSPISIHTGANFILPATLNPTAFFSKQAISCADLMVTKTVSNNTPVKGSLVQFTIVAKNNGPLNATGVNVQDLLPSGYSFVSSTVTAGAYNSVTGLWTIGNLSTGANVVLTVNAIVQQTGNYTNTATITSTETDSDLTNNSSSVTPTPAESPLQANLSVLKTVNNLAPVIGSNVIFTVAVTNNGPNNATGVNTTDLLPSGYTFVSATVSTGAYNQGTGLWTIGSLANGANATLTITATVKDAGIYTNTAVVKGTEEDPDLTNNTSSVTPVPSSSVLQANLSVLKTVDQMKPKIGDNVIFTIAARNLGPNAATNVKVTDILPAGYTFVSSTVTTGNFNQAQGIWTIGNLAVNANATLTITAKVNATGPYSNTATINGAEADPDPENNSSTVNPTPEIIMANLGVLKTVDNATPFIGAEVKFTILANNSGPSNASNVSITDVLPTGYTFVAASTTTGTYDRTSGIWSIGNLANNATATLTITAIVNATGPYSNTATIKGAETDPEPGNNSSTVTPVPKVDLVDLKIIKTVDVASSSVGDEFEYVLNVKNVGAKLATEVTVTDILPQGLTFVSANTTYGTATYSFTTNTVTWSVGNLAVAADVKLIIRVKADQKGLIANKAIVKSKETDSNPADNESTVEKEIFDLRMPNVITPNGDGNNDMLKFPGLNAYPENSLVVFNRWGNEVWNSNGNYKENWTGEGLNGGTYYYLLKIKDKSGKWQSFVKWIQLQKD